MSYAKQLIKDLKERKENQKTARAKFDEFTTVANAAASGVDHSYRTGISAATVAHTPIPTNVSIASLVIQLIAATPAIFETLNSDKPASEKLTALAPLLVLPSLAAVAVILTLLTFALAGAIVGVSLAGLIVGFTSYNLFKAYLAREAIGTTFENKLDSIQVIYDYLTSSDAKKAVSVDLDARDKLLSIVQARLTELKAKELNGLPTGDCLDNLQIALDELAAHVQKVKDITPEAIKLRQQIANEDQILSSGVNVGFAVAGVILAIIGVLALTIGAAPVVGTIVAIFSLVLMTVSLVQLATDLSLKRAESQKAEAVGDVQFEKLIQEAQLKTTIEKQATVTPVVAPLDVASHQNHVVPEVSPIAPIVPESVKVPEVSPITATVPEPTPVPDITPKVTEIATEKPEKTTPENPPNWRKEPAPNSGPGKNSEAIFCKKTSQTISTPEVEEKTTDSKRKTS